MSSAPAVPTNQNNNAAPTTKIESTDVAPHGQSVSAIGHEGAGPEEAMLHSGAWNSIDLALRMQFIALASFRWTTDQPPGTLLWSAPISPKHSHQFLRHLQKMYNIWVGGLEYNVKVCGTGFHAGALAVVRLPPNIPPNTVSSPADFTAFEYVVIDPKTLEVVSEHIIDQRRVMYHYNTDERQDSIGGYIAVYVLVPLATSSTGNQSISIQIFSRPSAQFNFFQLRPIEIENIDPEPDEPNHVVNTLSVKGDCAIGTSAFSDPVYQYRIAPKSFTSPQATSVGVYNFEGKYTGAGTAGSFPYTLTGYSSATFELSESGPGYVTIDALKDLPQANATHKMTMMYQYSSIDWKQTPTKNPPMVGPGKWQIQTAGLADYKGTGQVLYRITGYIEKDPKVFNKNNDESFFLFQNLKDGSIAESAYQTSSLAALCKSGALKDLMSPQEAMIVDMYDSELDIPVHRLKISYNGIVTTRGQDDEVVLQANKYHFRFVQYSRVSEPIPAPPQNYAYNSAISSFTQHALEQKSLLETIKARLEEENGINSSSDRSPSYWWNRQ